jgi:hypothetical protein
MGTRGPAAPGRRTLRTGILIARFRQTGGTANPGLLQYARPFPGESAVRTTTSDLRTRLDRAILGRHDAVINDE